MDSASNIDILGRPLAVGDTVAYAATSAGNGRLKVGTITNLETHSVLARNAVRAYQLYWGWRNVVKLEVGDNEQI